MSGFFKGIMKFFSKLCANTHWVTIAQAILLAASVAVETILDATGQEAEASAIGAVVNEAKAGFAAIAALIANYKSAVPGSALTNIGNILNSIKADLGQLLAAGHIKDTKTLGNVTSIVDIVINDVESLLKLLPIPTAKNPVENLPLLTGS